MTDSAGRILNEDMLIALVVRISSNRKICSANEGLKLEFFWRKCIDLVAAFISKNGWNNKYKLPNGKVILNPT